MVRMNGWRALAAAAAVAVLAGCKTDGGGDSGAAKPVEKPAEKKAAAPAAAPAPAKAPASASAPAPSGPPAVSALSLPGPGATKEVRDEHFVTKWLVLGPFTFGENDFGGDPQTAAVDKEFIAGEGALDGSQAAPAGTKWQAKVFRGYPPGKINLDLFYNSPEHAAAYAVAWVRSPKAISNANLYVGSDDYLKVWVNGKPVFTYNTERRASDRDQNKAEGVSLNEGLNRIVVKCVDIVYDWEFYLRIADGDDMPLVVKAE
jgi:hypothetical protein